MPGDSDSLAGDLIRAVEILGEVFEARGVRYALLGGLATMLRGRPRFTQDIDILLDVPQIALPGLLDELVDRGFLMDRDTVIRQFVQEHMTSFRFGVVRIDWLRPVLPLYAHALAAATSFQWTEGHHLRVLTPEGLIVTKLVAFRPQDQEDIRTLLAANRDEIDIATIRREWAAVSEGEEARSAWLEAEIAALKR
ncbi:MAG: nucleotidyl transferase AbiEii/AbiGii toxin family protein [Planctomycetia bacterium]